MFSVIQLPIYVVKMIKNNLPPILQVFKRFVACVPKHNPADSKDLEKLKDFINKHEKLLILTGAGISTESGMYHSLKYIYDTGEKYYYGCLEEIAQSHKAAFSVFLCFLLCNR